MEVFLTIFNSDKTSGIIVRKDASKDVVIGSSPFADITIEITSVKDRHLTIHKLENGRYELINNYPEVPCLVNDTEFSQRKELKFGDFINFAGKTFCWETKADIKRRTEHLSKVERKEMKNRFLKTSKRVTIHDVKFDATNDAGEKNITEENITCEELSPQKTSSDEGSPAVPDTKENLKELPPKIDLNLSGTLYTAYTPPKKITRSTFLSAKKSANVATPKPVLGEALVNQGSPVASKSMHLIDLTTPLVQKSATTSTPSSLRQTTPRSAAKGTPALRKQILLKSAIKSSAAKTRPEAVTPQTTPKGKMLFSEDSSTPQSSSLSTIEVSDSSIDEQYQTVEMKEIEEQNNEESTILSAGPSSSSPDKEMQDLLQSISSVLEENNEGNQIVISEEAKNESQNNDIKVPDVSLLPESDKTIDIDANFEKIAEKELSAHTIDQQFEELNENICTVEKGEHDLNKKAEELLNWVEEAKESLTSNQKEQILSSRYSNVTPNESTNELATENYDTTTPKLSILDAVATSASKRNSELGLTKSLAVTPVSRLSLVNDAINIVENYQLNIDSQKSLRSTRKHFSNAMTSLHDVSKTADTTMDMNDSLNATMEKIHADANQSQLEAEILSLDDIQADQKANVNTSPPGNNFIQFSEHGEKEKNQVEEIFGIDNSIVMESNEVDFNSSDSEVSDGEGSPDEQTEDVKVSPARDSIAMKFQLSASDLEEDGINPLEVSQTETDELDINRSVQEEANGNSENSFEHFSSQEETDFANMLNEKTLGEKTLAEEFESENISLTTSEELKDSEDVIPSSQDINEPAECSKTLYEEEEHISDSIQLQEEYLDTDNSKVIEEHLSTTNEAQNYECLDDEEMIPATQEEVINESCIDDTDTSLVVDKVENESCSNTPSVENVLVAVQSDNNSIPSDVSGAINEMITEPSDSLLQIATSPEFGQDLEEKHIEIPATQALDASQEDDDSKSLEFGEEINESSEKSLINPRESNLFSDTEFSKVEINPDFMQTDNEESPDIKNKELDMNVSEREDTFNENDVSIISSESEEADTIQEEMQNFDSEGMYIRKGFSMLPTEIAKASENNRQTMIPKETNEAFKTFINTQKEILKDKEDSLVPEDEERSICEKEVSAPLAPSQEIDSDTMNEEPEAQNRSTSVSPSPHQSKEKEKQTKLSESLQEESENDQNPPANLIEDENLATDAGEVENEDAMNEYEYLNKSPVHEEPCIKKYAYITTEDDDNSVPEQQKSDSEVIECSSDEMKTGKETEGENNDTDENADPDIADNENEIENEELERKSPITEELCVQKHIYLTTDKSTDESQDAAPETPSKRRTARVNYLELVSGTPKTPRRGKSVTKETPHVESKESNQELKMEPISEEGIEINIKVEAKKSAEEIESKNKEPEEPSTPSVRRRGKQLNYLEMATGSARSLRRGRSASVDVSNAEVASSNNEHLKTIELAQSSEIATPRRGRGRAPKKEEKTTDVQVEKAGTKRTQKIANLDVHVHEDKEASSPKKSRRQVTKEADPENVEKTNTLPDTPLENIDEEEHDTEKKVTKRAGRLAKDVQAIPEKKSRGRAKKKIESPVEEKQSDVEKSPPKRKGRTRKADVEISHDEAGKSEENPIPAKHVRGEAQNIVEKPVPEAPKRGRGRKPKESNETPEPAPKEPDSEDTAKEETEASIAKRGRRRAAKVTELKEPTVREEISTPKRGRGRAPKKAIESTTEDITATRDNPEPAQNVPESPEKEISLPKRGRAQKKAVASTTEDISRDHPEPAPNVTESPEKEISLPKRGRAQKKAAASTTEDITATRDHPEPAQNVPESPEKEISLPKRGRAKKVESQSIESQPEKEKETKKTRGRGAKAQTSTESQSEQQPTKRGRAHQVEEVKEPETIEPEVKKGRGRKAAVPQPEIETETPQKRTGRRVQIVTPSTQAAAQHSNENEKPTRARKRAVPEPVVEEVATKRPTRSRK